MKRECICAVGLGGQSVFLNVDHFHATGETIHATSIYSEPGGKAYNQIVAAARLGAQTVFIGAMGNDKNAQICEDNLIQEGVLPQIMKVDDADTAYACILTDAVGENRVTVYRGAADHLSAEYIYSCKDIISECSVMLLGLECPVSATYAALELAEKFHILTIFNPAPAKKLDMSLLRRFDIITPNRQEASILFTLADDSIKNICDALRENGIQKAVITLGADGALVFSGGMGRVFNAVKCTAVDTTGAGDCFSGALATELLRSDNFDKAVLFAINAAALSVTRHHVLNALPYLEAVQAAVLSHENEPFPVL